MVQRSPKDSVELELTFKDRRDWILPRVLEQRAKTHGDKSFLQFREGEEVTFAQVNERANRIAWGLARMGLAKGDRVMIMMPNCLELVYSWFGANKIGALEVPVNTAYKGYFLEHVANNCQAEVGIIAEEFLERIKASEEQLRFLKRIVVWDPEGKPLRDNLGLSERFELSSFEALFDAKAQNPEVELTYSDPAAIIYTSGTTGPSKGVLLPFANPHALGEINRSQFELTDTDVFFTFDPFFHIGGQFGIGYSTLIAGAKLVMDDHFSATTWIDQMRRSEVTVAKLIGGTAEFVFKQPESADDANNKLRAICLIPTPVEMYEPFKKRFGIKTALQGQYGMTETGLLIIGPIDVDRPGSAGKLVGDLFETRIADPQTFEALPPNTVGQLLVRPRVPWITLLGYNGMPEQTAEAWRDGWFCTGDALKVDEDGWYYFVDRIKDAIRRRGENISSYEVEKVVYGNPAVLECAAVPVKPQSRSAEDEVMVYVVLQQGATLTPEALIDWCDDRMPYFAVPRYLEFCDTLPRTPTAKVRKQELRDRGLSPNTWDREQVGYKTKEEIKRVERKKARSRLSA